MTQVDEIPMRRGKLQFSLATLLAVMTALAVFMGVGCWIGWLNVYASLVFVDWAGLVLVAILPLTVVQLGRSGEFKEHIGKVLVVAGTLLIISFVITGLPVGDRGCSMSLMCVALNFSVPAAAVELLIAIAFGKRAWRTRSFFFGATLTTIGVLASAWYGHYFFGNSLANFVWWL